MPPLGRPATALCLVALLVAGCSGEAAPRPAAVTLDWREVTLPAPSGPPGRLSPREAAVCEEHWYVVGAVTAADGATRPAAWSSRDGERWQAVATAPLTYYGHQHVLYSAACRDGDLVAVGGKPGGAHGNPRVSSWYLRDDGTLTEVRAGFELYGGPKAVNVGRLAAGPRGWLIAGNRTSGAAVWSSPDGTAFGLLEGAPELASDDRGESWAFDVTATSTGWLAAGGIVRPGRIDRDPLAWTSVDGVRWRRAGVPATREYEEIQRVVVADGAPVGVGLRGDRFGAWRGTPAGDGGPWRTAAVFGSGRSGRGVAAVPSLVALPGLLMSLTSDGSAYTGWLSTDAGTSWRRVTTPVALPAGADRAAALAAAPARILLVTDDGRTGRLWVVRPPLRR